MRARGRKATRGLALIQALIIVAAIAAVATALLLRAEDARLRIDSLRRGDQAALYLDSGVALVRAMIESQPLGAAVTLRQAWAQPRAGVVIDRGMLAWRVADLRGRFNVNDLGGRDPALARTGFELLAASSGLSRAVAGRLADALSPDGAVRAAAWAPGDAPAMPLADARQLRGLAGDEQAAFARLLRLIAARPPDTPVNLNTAPPEVLAAVLPGVGAAARTALSRHLRQNPAASMQAVMDWAQATLSPADMIELSAAPVDVTSTRFAVTIEARLDSVVLRRSVVVIRDDGHGRSAVFLSFPEPE